MSITTYGELQTAVANWIARDDLTSRIPEFIMLGEKRINRELRIRPMETALSSVIASGVIAVPSDYAALRHAYVNTAPVQALRRKPAEYIYENYPTRSSEGIPVYIAQEAGNFIFGPYPDSAYTVKGVYYAKFANLSDAAPTNWMITNAPEVLLFASLSECGDYMGEDRRVTGWETKYQVVLNRLMAEDKTEESSGSSMAMSAQ